MNNKSYQCLYCYKDLSENETDYHPSCHKKFFGTLTPILLPFEKGELEALSKKVILQSNDAFAFQIRFPLAIERKTEAEINKLRIAAEGNFTLKPPVAEAPSLPELEDLTLHLARILQIKTVEHSLIRLKSGELAFIYQRADRIKKGKLAMEDMCQLTGTLTDDKYLGSIEKIGKAIHTYSSNPGFDVISLFELTLFGFLTGCNDIHLKNVALLTGKDNLTGLSPVNALVPGLLIQPNAKDEMALSINGKKKNLTKSDFDSLAEKLKINAKTLDNTYKRFQKHIPQLLDFIDNSFLDTKIKQAYQKLLKQKAQLLFDLQFEIVTEETSVDIIENTEEVEVLQPDSLVELVEDTVVIEEAEPIEKNETANTVEAVEKNETVNNDEAADPIATEKPLEKKAKEVINVNTGEIVQKPDNDPSLRQLNLFG